MTDIDNYLARQEARRLADEAIAKAIGRNPSVPGHIATCLVSTFAKRSDFPETASLVKMTDRVAMNLAKLGLIEPVSLRHLPDKWWVINIDAYVLNRVREPGCGYVTVRASTDEMIALAFQGYCEAVLGPFDGASEIQPSVPSVASMRY